MIAHPNAKVIDQARAELFFVGSVWSLAAGENGVSGSQLEIGVPSLNIGVELRHEVNAQTGLDGIGSVVGMLVVVLQAQPMATVLKIETPIDAKA